MHFALRAILVAKWLLVFYNFGQVSFRRACSVDKSSCLIFLHGLNFLDFRHNVLLLSAHFDTWEACNRSLRTFLMPRAHYLYRLDITVCTLVHGVTNWVKGNRIVKVALSRAVALTAWDHDELWDVLLFWVVAFFLWEYHPCQVGKTPCFTRLMLRIVAQSFLTITFAATRRHQKWGFVSDLDCVETRKVFVKLLSTWHSDVVPPTLLSWTQYHNFFLNLFVSLVLIWQQF